MHNLSDGACCGQQYVGYGFLSNTVAEFYQRYWIFVPNTYVAVPYDFYSQMYLKTLSDFRVEPLMSTIGSTSIWPHIEADGGGIQASNNGGSCPHYNPVTFAIVGEACENYQYVNEDNTEHEFTTGTWHRMEWYVKRSPNPDGRLAYAIDGHVVADHKVVTIGPNNEPIRDLGLLMQYSIDYPVDAWFD